MTNPDPNQEPYSLEVAKRVKGEARYLDVTVNETQTVFAMAGLQNGLDNYIELPVSHASARAFLTKLLINLPE